MIDYSKKVMEYFSHPQNMGTIKNPDGVGRVGNPMCGDVMELQIKVGQKKDKEYIEDIKFQSFGCGAAIATSSMVTVMVKGKTLEEALKITKQDVSRELGGLPPVKEHCSNLAAAGLKAAVEDYRKKSQ